MPVVIAVAAGGALGSVLRYALATWVTQATRLGGSGTLVVNLLGAFALGLLLGLFEARFSSLPRPLTTGLTVGVLGGFTTFSSFMWDVVAHAESGRWTVALAMLLATVLLGVVAMVGGLALGRAV